MGGSWNGEAEPKSESVAAFEPVLLLCGGGDASFEDAPEDVEEAEEAEDESEAPESDESDLMANPLTPPEGADVVMPSPDPMLLNRLAAQLPSTASANEALTNDASAADDSEDELDEETAVVPLFKLLADCNRMPPKPNLPPILFS